ncbi:peptidyl-tRNA hydrolase, partial [Dimargaris cristalligena]
IVGLGNYSMPGTRHNVGMMVLDRIAQKRRVQWQDVPKIKGSLVRWEITLLKPKLLMNISGKSVARAAKEYGVSIDNILIVHDDMQRDIGKVALKEGGSANGHNGIKSAIDHLGTSNFRRLRIGIGRPPDDNRSNDLVARFVLSKFTPVESGKLEQLTYKYCLENWPSAFIDL